MCRNTSCSCVPCPETGKPLQHHRVGVVLGRKLVPGGMIRPCSFGGKGCRRTLRRGAVGRRYDAVNRVRRCGQKIGEVGGRFVSDNSGNDTSRVAAVRCGIEELHLGCVSGVGQTTGNLRCTRSYVAYARCGNSRGRVWGRIPAPISLFLEKPEYTVLIGRFTILISTPTGCRVNGQESAGCCVLYRPMVFCRCLISECPDVGCITRVNTQTVVIRNRTQRLRRVGCRGDREA